MRTKRELYQEAMRTVALRRQAARANAEDARAEAEAAIPALRHAEEEVRVRGVRCALAGASGGDRTAAAAALTGHVERYAHRFEAAERVGRIVAQSAAEARIDNRCNALNGERCLRNGRGQHHFAEPLWRRCQHPVLFLRRHQSVERHYKQFVILRRQSRQQLLAAHNLSFAGQESQNVALLFAQSLRHPFGHIHGAVEHIRVGQTENLHLMEKSAAFYHGSFEEAAD